MDSEQRESSPPDGSSIVFPRFRFAKVLPSGKGKRKGSAAQAAEPFLPEKAFRQYVPSVFAKTAWAGALRREVAILFCSSS